MYRTTRLKTVPSNAVCPQCKSTTVLYKLGSLICRNCDYVIYDGAIDKTEYGAKRVENTDYSKSRICQKCSKEYFKDRRINSSLWSKTKFCSPLCQHKSSRKYKNSKERSTAWRRKNGVLEIGSDELRSYIAKQTKIAMSRSDVQEKIRAPRSALTLERRMEISNNLAGKMPANLMYSQNFGNVKRGYYDINGTTIYFRSKWEANYALYLDWLIDNKEIYKWEFEPDTFMFEKIKLGTRSYTPDFKVYASESEFEYHEVKGYMDSKSKTKLKRFKKYYPQHKLVLIDSPTYLLLEKQVGKLCKFY